MNGKLTVLKMSAAALLVVMISVLLLGFANDSEHSMTTIILVRHAEKADDSKNPPLTEAGLARAEELKRMLSGLKVTAVYSSKYLRTEATAEPTATQFGLPVLAYDASDSAALVARIKTEHVGGTILVAGHSNTIPKLVQLFDARVLYVIEDDQYDDCFIVSLCSCGEVKTLNLKFGN